MNTDYLRAVTLAGDERQLSGVYLASVIRSTLRLLARQVGDVAATVKLLADADCDAVDRWRVPLRYPPDFRCLGFNAWLANNDSVDKAELLTSQPLNVSDVTFLYAALTGCPHLITNTTRGQYLASSKA